MVWMAGKEFVDLEPLLREMLEEKMREVEAKYPEPRSRSDERRIALERRRLLRELQVARRTAMWAVPPDES